MYKKGDPVRMLIPNTCTDYSHNGVVVRVTKKTVVCEFQLDTIRQIAFDTKTGIGVNGNGIIQKVTCDEIDFLEDIQGIGSVWQTTNKRTDTKSMIGASTPTTGDIEDYIRGFDSLS